MGEMGFERLSGHTGIVTNEEKSRQKKTRISSSLPPRTKVREEKKEKEL